MANRTVNSLTAATGSDISDTADQLYLARLGATPADRKMAVGELMGKQLTITSSTAINLGDYLGDLVLNCRGVDTNAILTISGTPKPGRKLIVFGSPSATISLSFVSPLTNAGPATLAPQSVGLWILGSSNSVTGVIIPSPGAGWAAESSGESWPVVLDATTSQLKRNACHFAERRGGSSDANSMTAPAFYGVLAGATNLPADAQDMVGTMLVQCVQGIRGSTPARWEQIFIQDYAVWVREGVSDLSDYDTVVSWGAWKRIDCDRERLLPKVVFYVETAAEFGDALNAPCPAGGIKVIWALQRIHLTASTGQSTMYRAALTADTRVYGLDVYFDCEGFLNTGSALYSLSFYNTCVWFTWPDFRLGKTRLLIKRAGWTADTSAGIADFVDGAIAWYEANYVADGLCGRAEGGAPPTTYGAWSTWNRGMWDNTSAGGGGGGMTNPMTQPGQIIYALAGGVPAALNIGQNGQFLGVQNGALAYLNPPGGVGCTENFALCTCDKDTGLSTINNNLRWSRIVAKSSMTASQLGIFPTYGSLGSFILGIYDAETGDLLAQTSKFTPTTMNKVWWQATTSSFLLTAGKEYDLCFYSTGDTMNFQVAGRELTLSINKELSASAFSSNLNSLPASKPTHYADTKTFWMVVK